MEEWKTIKQSENYSISNLGNFKNNKFNKLLKLNINKKGYTYCNISVRGKVSKVKIHRLVAIAFVDNPNNLPTVNHKDGNKRNNYSSNLEWMTELDNKLHYHNLLKNKIMPILKINSCKECPHQTVEREHWMDDCFRIFCGHEEQTNTEGYVTKISRSGGIFFNCPLDKPEIIECSNSDCDWKGTKDEMRTETDWGDNEYCMCPKCSEWLL